MAGTPVYSLIEDGGGKFAIVGNSIVVAAPLDYETASSHTVTVAVTGVVPRVGNRSFTIGVIDVVEPMIEMSGGSIAESASIGDSVATFSVVYTSGSPVFTLVSDPGAKFSLVGSVLKVAAELDYEAQGFHNVTIAVSGVVPTFANRTFTITVINVGADVIRLSNSTLPENAEPGYIIGELTVPEGTGIYIYTVTADPDTMFDINSIGGGKEGSLDYETQTTHEVTVQANNSVDPILTRTFTINVIDIVADDEMRQPVVVSLSPIDGAVSVPLASNLVITFDTPVAFATGDIELFKWDGTLIESFDVVADVGTGSGQVNISGTVLTINPTALMLENTRYYVLIGDTCIDDLVGNSFQGFIINSMWNWVASALAGPGLLSFMPADNATDVSIGAILTATFHEDVTLGASGTIYLKKTSDNSVVDSWNVATDAGSGVGQVATSGPDLILRLSTDLGYVTQYYVVWDANVVKDIGNDGTAALVSTTAWSFTTEVNDRILDTYTVGLAYSLRHLRLAYAGNCIRIRRSSDNTEQNFGFVGERVNTAGILTFIGAGTGYVSTLFDQSGNAVDLTQATAAAQPEFIVSGIGAEPTLRFDGVDDYLASATVAASVISNANEITIMAVMKQVGTQVDNCLCHWTPFWGDVSNIHVDATVSDGLYFTFGQSIASPPYGAMQVAQPSGWDDTPHILECYRETGDVQAIGVDGVTLLSQPHATGNTGTASFMLGFAVFSGFSISPLLGDVSEFFILKTDVGATERALIRTDMAEFYEITV